MPQTTPSSLPPSSSTILPPPFDWIDIPKRVSIVVDEGYRIAKYPVTNAQFAKFIEADGYNQKRWWTNTGWEQREKGNWTQPRFWTDTQWNGADYPVIGVSFYESVAFCRWLGEVTSEKIMLPTERQWLYAAQGDHVLIYPWGHYWDASLCNNNVDSKGIGKTTPVGQYEGKGDSPFGVVDMVGNVWEWCLTGYKNEVNNSSGEEAAIVRGGSWNDTSTEMFQCNSPYKLNSDYWNYFIRGFRIVRL